MIKKMVLYSLRLVYEERVFGCSEEWYHFQQELMVSKTVVKVFR